MSRDFEGKSFEEEVNYRCDQLVGKQTLDANQEAASAFLSMFGGFEGYLASGGTMETLYDILDADPKDDLSGLRDIARDTVYGHGLGERKAATEEPYIDPEAAREWLLAQGRAKEKDGRLVLLTPKDQKPEHWSVVGLSIALSGVPQKISDVYRDIMGEDAPWSESTVIKMANAINSCIPDNLDI
jgi:hypothetical protein